MKCLSRSTLGVVIGVFNIFGFTIAIIYILTLLSDISSLPEEDKEKNVDIFTTSITLLYIVLIICIVSLVTSLLLVMGIIKERHSYMKPWICSSIVSMGLYGLRVILTCIIGLTSGIVSVGTVLAALVIGCLVLGLQFLIFYPIYTLYTDIRDATNAQEQRGLNGFPQNSTNYGELEKGEEMFH